MIDLIGIYNMNKIYLSRRNLLALLSKLNRNVKAGCEVSACTLIKRDNVHPLYPQSMGEISVIAIEDEVYYNRAPGEVHPFDEPICKGL